MNTPCLTRRGFIQGACGLMLASPLLRSLSASAETLPPSSSAAPSKPNIIFVLFDDLGYGEPTSYRKDSPIKMPHLDALATEGMRFTDAHSASAVCTPTRYGFMTGRYPWRINQFGVLTHMSPPIIEADRLTIAAMMKSQGYHTACIGKWHLGMNIDGNKVADGPITRGFDHFLGYTEARSIAAVIEQDKVIADMKDVEVSPMLAKKTEEYIDQRAKTGEPFFLYVPLSQPHTPHVPSPQFVGKSGLGSYGDWMMQGDATLGIILAAIDRNQLADNTLIIVSSDNGAAGKVYAPLRGCKTQIWEGGHREPLVARWPGKIKPGSVCDDTVCLNDLFATCAEIVGAKLPADAAEDSFSILPDLLGTATSPVREATTHQSMKGDLAIRQGPWKLVLLVDGSRELYNLRDDLSETRNIAADHPEQVAKLSKLLEQYADTGRSTPGPALKATKIVPRKSRAHAKATPE